MEADTIEGHERKWWNELYESKDSKRKRRECHQAFRHLFPQGHQESLRDLVLEFGQQARNGGFKSDGFFGYLNDVHPDAFDILVEYGQDYTPLAFRKPPVWGEPEVGKCYRNAWELTLGLNMHLDKHPRVKNRARYVYVEGIAMGPVVYPMAHAWVARGYGGMEALDWTLYATTKWVRYLGIPFMENEFIELANLTNRGNVFEKRYFKARAKKRLVEMLEARRASKATTQWGVTR